MNYGLSLIDKAGETCGSFYKLHKLTGFAQATISEIRAEKRRLPLEWVPVLAEIAGVDPIRAVALVLHEQLPEGRAKEALKKPFTGGGVEISQQSKPVRTEFCDEWEFSRCNLIYIVSIGKLRAMLGEPSTWGFTPYPTPRPTGRGHAASRVAPVCLQRGSA